MDKITKARERFIEKVFPEPMSGCWLWDGYAYELPCGKRYRPYFSMGNKSWPAHRAAILLFIGEFPLEKYICHKCDNTLCVNPDHLYVGDHASNMRDMAERNRHWSIQYPKAAKAIGRRLGRANTHSRGEGNPGAKLTEQQVRKIRASDDATRILAQRYGVHRTTIQRIRSGEKWSSIK